jgi:Fe-S cluster biogenesis protein NfuA
MTLKAGVERIMRDRVEGVTEIVTANLAPYWE